MNSSFHRGRRALALVLAAAGLFAVGCDQSGDAEFRLREARELIRVLNSGSGSSTPPKETRALAAKVKKTLEPVTKSGHAGEAAAAQIMVAEAELAEAGLLAEEASNAALEHFRRIDETRTSLESWSGLTRRAERAEAVDFSKEIAALNAQRVEREKSRADLAAELDRVDKLAAQLHNRAETLDKQALDANNQAGTLALRADGSGSRDAVVLVRQSMFHKRTGDAYEFQADEIRAEVQNLMPQKRELQLLLAQADGDIKALTRAVAELTDAQAAAADQARALRAEARSVAKAIDDAIFDSSSGLATHRTAVLAKASEEAAGAFGRARMSASGANAKARGTATTTMARASAGAAGASWAQVLADQHYLALLQAVSPALGADSPRLADELQTVEASLAASRDAAATALADAVESYNSVSGTEARLYAAHIQHLMGQGMMSLGGTAVDFDAIVRDTRARLAAGQEPPQPEILEEEPQEPLDGDPGDGSTDDPADGSGEGTTGEG